jgi:uncharacterized protein (DUF2384 family)
MSRSEECLLRTLGLSTPSFKRKKRMSERLSKPQSERVLGLARLIGQVEAMVAESGMTAGFNAARWIGSWLAEPLAPLGGLTPGELMDTMEGQAIVSNLLARAQSGAYS